MRDLVAFLALLLALGGWIAVAFVGAPDGEEHRAAMNSRGALTQEVER